MQKLSGHKCQVAMAKAFKNKHAAKDNLQTMSKVFVYVYVYTYNYARATRNQHEKVHRILAILLAVQRRPLLVRSVKTRTVMIGEPSTHHLSKAQDFMVVIMAMEVMKYVHKLSFYMDQVAVAEVYGHEQAAKYGPMPTAATTRS